MREEGMEEVGETVQDQNSFNTEGRKAVDG
jgi:hypothetical protein